MRRGTIVTIAGGPDYAGKPRPAVIVRSDLFDVGEGVTLCPTTHRETDASILRLRIEPDDRNGLRLPSWVMIEKITTLRKSKVGRRMGQLTSEQMRALSEALLLYLGLADREAL